MTENIQATGRPLTGRKFAIIIVSCFAVILGANLTLAFKAVSTFPGLETDNSYVASQQFDKLRAAQDALGWDVAVQISDRELLLSIRDPQGDVVRPASLQGLFGRATNVRDDQQLQWRETPEGYAAPVRSDDGNWNLRLSAKTADGVAFQRRIVIIDGQG
jgi:nitrogen fixation protein FixH